MSLLKVALLQMAPCGNQEANLAKGETFCRKARDMGADIALFPEMWNIGYTFYDHEKPGDYYKWASRAITAEDPFVLHYRKLADELNMAIAVTYLEKWPDSPRNSVSLIDRNGEIKFTYAKVHTCDFSPEVGLTPGDDFPVATLDTEQGPVEVGCMICYDREHPESARILMLNGAEIVLTPNACMLEGNRIGQFRTRAFENMIGVAMTNYATPKNNGHSVAFDAGTLVSKDGDMLLVQAGEEEDVFIATFDLDNLRAYRERGIWGNAYRRPACYDALLSTEVSQPFIRPNARR